MAADGSRRAGPAEVGECWARALAARGPAWLHLDLDALDEAALPAISYPQPCGLDRDSFVALARPLLSSDGLVGTSVADFNPDLDEDGAQGFALALREEQQRPTSLSHPMHSSSDSLLSRSRRETAPTDQGAPEGSLTSPFTSRLEWCPNPVEVARARL